MARSRPSGEPPGSQLPRSFVLAGGAALGALWGSLMWLIFTLAGQDSGARGWAYLAITMGMIGGGVAAIFGAAGARKRGERVIPKVKPPFRRR